MKILYAIQGTGNGHISRALEIIPILKFYGKVDVLLSGTQCDLKLPYKVDYYYNGLSYHFGNNGEINLINTYRKSELKRLWKDIQKVPVDDYDLVINDFEPISAWACHFRKVMAVSLSHQSAVLAAEAPKPKVKDLKGYLALKYYAPCELNYGFHFQNYNETINTPVIRSQIRQMSVRTGNHVTVYLPSFSEAYLINYFMDLPYVQWDIFSREALSEKTIGHIRILPLDNENFVKSMCSSYAVLCGADFETPAEALFLGKKLAVVPMKRQFEQRCNAAALKQMGMPVIKNLKDGQKHKITNWLNNGHAMRINYPDQTDFIINRLISQVDRSLSSSNKVMLNNF